MEVLLHWSVGFIMGTLIVLPFILGRWVYDYDNHTWVQVVWGPVVNKGAARKLKIRESEVATPELHPITSSRFVVYHLIIANICGLLALFPDVVQVWFGTGVDQSLWADIFFFHATIDKLSAGTVESISGFIVIAALLVWLIVVSIAMGAQNDRDCRESVVC